MCVCVKMFVLLAVLVVVACAEDARSESFCKLDSDAGVQYCFDPTFINGLRRCNTYEPEDVIVRPGCIGSNRYSNQSLAPRRCVDGEWVDVFSCKSAVAKPKGCKLDSHPSVHYNCPGPDNTSRRCGSFEPDGTIVSPKCIEPAYASTNPPLSMKCIDGEWDNVVTCLSECGRVSVAESLLEEGRAARPAMKGELPWHASIYVRIDTEDPYEEICGGSLVSKTVVISAAHTFWSSKSKKLYPFKYAVAVGKLFRLWDDMRDVDAQKSDVKTVHLPKEIQGDLENYHSDIVIVVVATAFQYNDFVRPVCLNFDDKFKRGQLQAGRIAKVAAWLNGNTGQPATLMVTEFTHILGADQCRAYSPEEFKQLIAYDKICAQHTNNESNLCVGDTGGGLVIPLLDSGSKQYYLQGVVSNIPVVQGQLCSRYFITLTDLIKYESFIKTFL